MSIERARLAGIIYIDDEFVRGSIEIESGVITGIETSPGEPEKSGPIYMPGFINMHTHLGDSFITAPEGMPLEELVQPPNGYKHRMLASAEPAEIIQGMKGTIEKMKNSGTLGFCDYREQGIGGAIALKEANSQHNLPGIILGRPGASGNEFDSNEIAELLRAADGIGLSGLQDVPYDVAEKLARAARSAGRLFSLHASEGARDDIDEVLDLKPDFIIHMASAELADIERAADAGVPIVVCPRSNSRFGLKPDIEGMLNAGAVVCAGTDNAMLASPSVLDEIQYISDAYPGLNLAQRAEIALINPRKALNQMGCFTVKLGSPAYIISVNPESFGEPAGRVLSARRSEVSVVSCGAGGSSSLG